MEKEIVLTKKMLQMEFEKVKKTIKLGETTPFLGFTASFAKVENGKNFDTNEKNMYEWLEKKLEKYKDVEDENEVLERFIEREKEVNVIKMGTLDKILTENRLWGCGFDYDETTGNYVLCDKRPNRFKPYLAVCPTGRKEHRRYLDFGGRVTYGEFDVKNVRYGDVLVGGFYDKQKGYSVRTEFYVVLSNNKDGLTIADGSWTTYNEANSYSYYYKNKRKYEEKEIVKLK